MTVCPLIADLIRAANILGTANTRKLFNSVGMFGAGIFLIGLSFLDCTKKILAVILLIGAVTTSGCVYCGYFVNHMDIAPQYAGTLMGIANGIAVAAGFIAPSVASALTKDAAIDPTRAQESWQKVFFIAAAVYAIGGILYCILAKGTVQDWAKDSLPEVEMDVVTDVPIDGESGHGPIYKGVKTNGNAPSTEPMLLSKEKF
jgi:MFS family permease